LPKILTSSVWFFGTIWSMRSHRLLSMLLLLQIRQRMTARQLAEEFGVSERTVLRDVLALAEADVPVFAEQGRHGGIVLFPGSRLDVNRLTPSEVDALRLIGLDPNQAAQLGLDISATQRKLATRPTPDTGRTIPLSELVMIDNRGWFEDGSAPIRRRWPPTCGPDGGCGSATGAVPKPLREP
jgi:hypothetical protein